MKKKILAIVMSIVLVCGVVCAFAACGNEPAKNDETTEAPAAGDVAADTDSTKGSPDTGIEDVAVIGGLAVLAGAAIAFTRKRK